LTSIAAAGYGLHSMRREAITTWAALMALTVLIWNLGSDDFSSIETSRFLRPLLDWLFPGLSAEGLDAVHFAVRKGAHALEYGVHAVLTLRAVVITWGLSFPRSAILAIAFALALAACDEGRQSFSDTRGGSWTDVLLDLTAAGLSVAAVQALPGRTKRTLVGTKQS
jgi:VanZ family protein